MEYSIFKKQTVNGETTKYNATKETLEEARKAFHSQLAASYGTDGLEHLMCVVINDSCGIEMKECYYAPTTTTDDTTDTTEDTTEE